MTTPIIIQLVADYGNGDPAYAEVVQKLTFLDRHIRVNKVNVPKFSTVATAMWTFQLATVNAHSGLVIYSNTAPRIKSAEGTYKEKYGHFAYGELDNGVEVMAVHVGFTFSLIKSHMKSFHLINVPNIGSQFRSRDFYPDAVVGIARGNKKFIGEAIPLQSIPQMPDNLIGFIDGYGNLKTTLRQSKFHIREGTRVKITVGGVIKQGHVGGETYHVKDGEVSFAPGSTGGDDRFMEIWVRGDSAWEAFGKPGVESKFEVQAL